MTENDGCALRFMLLQPPPAGQFKFVGHSCSKGITVCNLSLPNYEWNPMRILRDRPQMHDRSDKVEPSFAMRKRFLSLFVRPLVLIIGSVD